MTPEELALVRYAERYDIGIEQAQKEALSTSLYAFMVLGITWARLVVVIWDDTAFGKSANKAGYELNQSIRDTAGA